MNRICSARVEANARSLCRNQYEREEDVGYAAAHLLKRCKEVDWGIALVCLLSCCGRIPPDQPAPQNLKRMGDEEWMWVKESIRARLEHILEILLDGHLVDEEAAEFLAEQTRGMTEKELAVALAIILCSVAPYEHLPDELFGDGELVDTAGVVFAEIQRVARQLTSLSYRQDISVLRLWKVALFLISGLDGAGQAEMLAFFHEMVPQQRERVGDRFAEYDDVPPQQVLYLGEDRVFGGDGFFPVVRGEIVERAVATCIRACFPG